MSVGIDLMVVFNTAIRLFESIEQGVEPMQIGIYEALLDIFGNQILFATKYWWI